MEINPVLKGVSINLIVLLHFYCRKTTAEILVICMILMIDFRSLYCGLVIRARTPFMLHSIQVVIHPKGFVDTVLKKL